MPQAYVLSRGNALVDAKTQSGIRIDLAGAMLAGQVSGLIMAFVMMFVFFNVLGTRLLFPVQLIGSLVFGDSAIQGVYIPAALVGVVLHQLGPALFWSVVFGLFVWALNARHGLKMVTLGLTVGIVSQIVDVELIMPVAMNALHGHDLWAEHVPAFWSKVTHVVYGLGLGVFPWARQVMSRASRSHGTRCHDLR